MSPQSRIPQFKYPGSHVAFKEQPVLTKGNHSSQPRSSCTVSQRQLDQAREHASVLRLGMNKVRASGSSPAFSAVANFPWGHISLQKLEEVEAALLFTLLALVILSGGFGLSSRGGSFLSFIAPLAP